MPQPLPQRVYTDQTVEHREAEPPPTPPVTGIDALPMLADFEQVADVTGIEGRVVKRAMADGSLPAVKVGRKLLVPRDAIAPWVAGLVAAPR